MLAHYFLIISSHQGFALCCAQPTVRYLPPPTTYFFKNVLFSIADLVHLYLFFSTLPGGEWEGVYNHTVQLSSRGY